MANLFLWFLAAVVPLAKRVLISLGIGFVSYTALTAALNAVISQVSSNISSIPYEISSFLAISGLFTAMGIIFGGVMARVSLMAVERFGKVL